MKKRSALKFIRNTIISVVVILLVLVGAAAAYVWFFGNQAAEVEGVVEIPKTAPVSDAPQKPLPTAKVSISAQSFTSPISPGDNASITIKTNAEAVCTITVTYDEVESTDSGLSEKIANDYGMITWAWTVEESRPTGEWPVEITCKNLENSAYYKADLELKYGE